DALHGVQPAQLGPLLHDQHALPPDPISSSPSQGASVSAAARSPCRAPPARGRSRPFAAGPQHRPASRGATGALAEYATCGAGPHTEIRSQAGIRGLDAAARGELRFAPAPTVTVQVAHF